MDLSNNFSHDFLNLKFPKKYLNYQNLVRIEKVSWFISEQFIPYFPKKQLLGPENVARKETEHARVPCRKCRNYLRGPRLTHVQLPTALCLSSQFPVYSGTRATRIILFSPLGDNLSIPNLLHFEKFGGPFFFFHLFQKLFLEEDKNILCIFKCHVQPRIRRRKSICRLHRQEVPP